jgi:hypothetical protein
MKSKNYKPYKLYYFETSETAYASRRTGIVEINRIGCLVRLSYIFSQTIEFRNYYVNLTDFKNYIRNEVGADIITMELK